jgi:lactate dehydrogenase-like 2-hydroxyacid dehydrogenase
MDNVVLTPHAAAFSDYAFDTMKRRVGQACVDIFQGRWPGIVANPTVKPRAALPPQ